MDLLARICSSGKLKFRYFFKLKMRATIMDIHWWWFFPQFCYRAYIFFVDQTLGYAYPGSTGAHDKQSRICLSRGNLEAI